MVLDLNFSHEKWVIICYFYSFLCVYAQTDTSELSGRERDLHMFKERRYRCMNRGHVQRWYRKMENSAHFKLAAVTLNQLQKFFNQLHKFYISCWKPSNLFNVEFTERFFLNKTFQSSAIFRTLQMYYCFVLSSLHTIVTQISCVWQKKNISKHRTSPINTVLFSKETILKF